MITDTDQTADEVKKQRRTDYDVYHEEDAVWDQNCRGYLYGGTRKHQVDEMIRVTEESWNRMLQKGHGYNKHKRMGKTPFPEKLFARLEDSFKDVPEKIAEARKHFENKQEPEGLQGKLKTSSFETLPAKAKKETTLVAQNFNYLTSGILQENIECKDGVQKSAKYKIEGFEDPRMKWIGDCIADKIGRDIDFKELGIPEFGELSVADIYEIIKHPECLSKLPPIIVDVDDFWRLTGRKDIRGWQVEEMFVHVWKKGNFEGKFECFYANKHWHEIDLYSHFLADMIIEKYGIASRRRKKNLLKGKESDIKRRFICHLGTIFGVIFLSGLAKGRFCIFPKAFYKLSDALQEVYRYYSVFKGKPEGVNPTLDTLLKLMGRKKNVKYPSDQIQQIKKELKELENLSVKTIKRGKGKNTSFHFEGCKPELPPKV